MVLIAGCGGGGDGGRDVEVVSVTPTPSATASPTGPTGIAATGEVKPSAGAVFLAATLELVVTGGVRESDGIVTGGATKDRATTFDTPMFSATYDPSAGYRLADGVASASFGSRQLARDTTTPNGNGVVAFADGGAGVEDYLVLYQQTTITSGVRGTASTTARYGGTGSWQHTTAEPAGRRTRLDYFAYGVPTPVSSMPRAGRARFTVLSSGNYATDSDLLFLSSGSGNVIDVDFGAGTVSGKVLLAGTNFFKSEVGGIGYVQAGSSIVGNQAMTSFTDGSLGTSGDVPGRLRLMFVGPAAEEMVMTFVAQDGSGAVVGAAVAVRDPNLN